MNKVYIVHGYNEDSDWIVAIFNIKDKAELKRTQQIVDNLENEIYGEEIYIKEYEVF